MTPRKQSAGSAVRAWFAGMAGVLMAAVVSSPVLAQESDRVTLGAGYVNLEGTMNGGNVEIALPLNDHWRFVGEFGAAIGPDYAGEKPVYHDFAGLVGVRHSWPRRTVSPFWQLLGGAISSEAQPYAYDDGGCTCQVSAYKEHFLGLQPGAGVVVMMNSRFGFKVQGDLQIYLGEYVSIFPRVNTGIVIALGR